MRTTRLAIWCFISSLLPLSAEAGRMLSTEPLDRLTPQGWLADLVQAQERNFTGILDKTAFPFTQGGWGAQPFLRVKNGVTEEFWVPYEQTAYYYDGMIRLGYLLDSAPLLDKARRAVYGTIDRAGDDGLLGPRVVSKEMSRWVQAVFFRAMMAEYEVTRNQAVVEALERHFRNDTVRYTARSLCNIEVLDWLYRETGDDFFKTKALSMLDEPCFGEYTLRQAMERFAADERTEIHAVTFHEFLKLPVLFYDLTGDRRYLDLARAAFAKLDRYHMLPDGVASGEEGLSGRTARSVHEMCNVVDYMWTCSYMLRATGDTQFADRIEYALFNAGLGGITKNFDAHQYYSAPNQVVCTEYSNHTGAYDNSRFAYRQVHRPSCCTGNLNRLLPIYAGAQWMHGEGEYYKMLYGPGEATLTSREGSITVREESAYPFGDKVLLSVVEGEAEMLLHLRIPGWCDRAEVYVNNQKITRAAHDGYFDIHRLWKTGDRIELRFPKQVRLQRWDHEAMVVTCGPLLMALPVESHTVQTDVLTPAIQSFSYKGYTMTPASKWNFALGVADEQDKGYKLIERNIGADENPWTLSPSPLTVVFPGYELAGWQLEYRKIVHSSGSEIFAPVTPGLPARGIMIFALNNATPQLLRLEPYGRTTLRIAMFPFGRVGEVPPEVQAAE